MGKKIKLIFVISLAFALSLIFAVSSSAATGLTADSVYVGESITARVDVLSGTTSVTWSCSPYGIVEFQNSTPGSSMYSVNVVGKLPGTTTIRAVVKDAYGNTSTVTVGTVQVILSDGIYTVRNNYTDQNNFAGGTYYLRSQVVEDNDLRKFIPQLSQNNFVSISENDIANSNYEGYNNRIYNYWRIVYLENGEYVLRSLADENRALNYSNNALSMTKIGSTIPEGAKWKIQGNYIKPKSNQSKCLAFFSPDPNINQYYEKSEYYNYFDLTVSTIGDMAFEKWSFSTNDTTMLWIRDNYNGCVYDSISIVTNTGNSHVKLEDYDYSLLSFVNGIETDVIWSFNDLLGESIAIVNSDGEITPISIGTRVLTATLNLGGNQTKSVTITINVTAPDCGITDSTKYYIINYNSQRVLSLQNSTDANLVKLYTQEKSSVSQSKWTVEKQSNSKYQLINNIGSATRVLTIMGSDAYIYSDSNITNQRLELCRIDGKDYQGMYYIKYGAYYLTEGNDYKVGITSEKSDASVWSFIEVDKGGASLYSFTYFDFVTTYNNQLFEDCLSDLGYNTDGTLVNKSAYDAYSDLENNAEVFVFAGHGNPGFVTFNCYDRVNEFSIANGMLVANSDGFGEVNDNSLNEYVDNYSDNALSSARCVMYIACNTGLYYNVDNDSISAKTYGLVESTYMKGAHFVLGTTEKVTNEDAVIFLEVFLQELQCGGNSIAECINKALIEVGYSEKYVGGMFPITYKGDVTQTLD